MSTGFPPSKRYCGGGGAIDYLNRIGRARTWIHISGPRSSIFCPRQCNFSVRWCYLSGMGNRWRWALRGDEEQAIRLNLSPSPSEWPLCCTRLGPPTAMDLGAQSMHRWRRGTDTPWKTPVSGLPLCMCWGISSRAWGSWPPPSSSTSRYCCGGRLSLSSLSWYPLLSSLSFQLPRVSPSPSVRVSACLWVLFAKMNLEPPLRDITFSAASVQGG